MNLPEGLDVIILNSLSKIKDEATRKKMANNILLCGGGAKIGELQDF
jgi:actin-related protein